MADALPAFTLTDPYNKHSEMSAPMSPASPVKRVDSNTSFEFDRPAARPGTASSVGDGTGMSPAHAIASTRRSSPKSKYETPRNAMPRRFFVSARPAHVQRRSEHATCSPAHARTPS